MVISRPIATAESDSQTAVFRTYGALSAATRRIRDSHIPEVPIISG